MGITRYASFVLAVLMLGCGSEQISPRETATVVHVEAPPAESAAEPEEGSRAEPVREDDGCKKLNAAIPPRDVETISVFVRLQGSVCLGALAVEPGDIAGAAQAAAESGARAAVIYADESVAYKVVVEVMDALKRGGIQRMSLAVQKAP